MVVVAITEASKVMKEGRGRVCTHLLILVRRRRCGKDLAFVISGVDDVLQGPKPHVTTTGTEVFIAIPEVCKVPFRMRCFREVAFASLPECLRGLRILFWWLCVVD